MLLADDGRVTVGQEKPQTGKEEREGVCALPFFIAIWHCPVSAPLLSTSSASEI